MTIEKLNTGTLFSQLDEATNVFHSLIKSADENKIHVVPFAGSWTVAQLASHVTKSNKAIVQALGMPGEPAHRNADERVKELKKMFLDFNTKFQSPEFIMPTKEMHSKKEVIEKYDNSAERLKTLRSKTNLSEVISLPLFGEITKFEILYFVLYHTQRHIHQLKNMLHIINHKN